MDIVLKSKKSWDRSLNDVTRICLAATAGCFLVGGALVLADYVAPLAPRGIALLAVGCFFLVHGLFEFAKQLWQSANATRANRTGIRVAGKHFPQRPMSESSEYAAV